MFGKTTTALLAAAMFAGSVAVAQARDLTVASWGGTYQKAQKQVWFDPFVKETGIPMTDDAWDGGIGVLRAKVEGGNANWDVVQVESDELLLGCEEGLFEPLDWSRIGGKDNYLPAAVHECGVGVIFWDFVLAYDKNRLKAAPKGWADFFDTKTFPGKRALRSSAKSTLEIALMADGVAIGDVYKVLGTKEGQDRAFKKLDSIKKDLIFWKAGAQPSQFLAAGEVVMTSAYNGRIDAANKTDHRNFGITWNGALYTVDSEVILKGSPNQKQAYAFLNYIGKPEVQIKLSPFIAYGPTSKRATDLVDPKRRGDLPTAPENMKNALKIDAAFWLENNDRLNERFNKWAATK